ncbi:MAG: hypothetical protein IKN81_09320 [Oscillospiraceae bacterium]|nr:hypothetical protein [Oscillospiraceae bacterium]
MQSKILDYMTFYQIFSCRLSYCLPQTEQNRIYILCNSECHFMRRPAGGAQIVELHKIAVVVQSGVTAAVVSGILFLRPIQYASILDYVNTISLNGYQA